MRTALSFDDVLLVPQYSRVLSRKDPDTSTIISRYLSLKIPVISSCMDTVTESAMAIAMYQCGGLGILHRYNSIAHQLEMLSTVQSAAAKCAVAIGATGDYLERAEKLIHNGADIVCIDVANGNSSLVEIAVGKLRKMYNNITIIAGNVATGEGCARLIDAGADTIRAGIGGGSLCSTRIVSGSGVPTLQTILDCKEYLYRNKYEDFCILADGGIKNSGDVVKSIAAGACGVIVGQILAATNEAPGEIIEDESGKYKKYRGMASRSAQMDWRGNTGIDIVPEGEETILPYKGNTKNILSNLIGGLRSGMSYSNAITIKELQYNAEFIRITSAGWTESKPHAKII